MSQGQIVGHWFVLKVTDVTNDQAVDRQKSRGCNVLRFELRTGWWLIGGEEREKAIKRWRTTSSREGNDTSKYWIWNNKYQTSNVKFRMSNVERQEK